MSIIEDLSKKTVMEIKSYAKKNNIDLFGVKTKAHMLEVIASWTPREKSIVEPEVNKIVDEKIALFSERNIFWNGVGSFPRNKSQILELQFHLGTVVVHISSDIYCSTNRWHQQ